MTSGSGVASRFDPTSDPEFASTWRDYLELPAQRALAIAGNPERGRWVVGAAGAHPTLAQAEQAALDECRRRRRIARMQPACVLFAVGDEIVWRGH